MDIKLRLQKHVKFYWLIIGQSVEFLVGIFKALSCISVPIVVTYVISLFIVLFLKHKVLIDPANRDLVHHLVVYECDPATTFDDANLPDGACDNVYAQIPMCVSNSASVWAIGGDDVSLLFKRPEK